jgi:hypothetical protein
MSKRRTSILKAIRKRLCLQYCRLKKILMTYELVSSRTSMRKFNNNIKINSKTRIPLAQIIRITICSKIPVLMVKNTLIIIRFKMI